MVTNHRLPYLFSARPYLGLTASFVSSGADDAQRSGAKAERKESLLFLSATIFYKL